jgi:hypothetical protein
MQSNISSLPVPTKKGGRPPGARNKKTLWVEEMLSRGPDVRKFVETIKRLALGGDPDFAKMWVDRIAPARKGALLRFNLPPIRTMDDVLEGYGGLLQAVSQGLISSAEAVELSTVLDRMRQGLESRDLEERIARLEADAERRAA